MARQINLTKTKQEVAKALKTVEELKADRSASNEDIAAIRARMEAMGIPRPAFDAALKYKSWDIDKRKGFDAAYALAREAIGLPFDAQGELFIPDDEDDAGEAEQATLQ